MAAKVLGVDHTGITASSLDLSLSLWPATFSALS